MNRTGIEWADLTWNPVTGCTRGCHYCYARRMAYRLKGRHGYPLDDPFRPTLHEDKLDEPLRRKKPAKIFTVSMGELFADDIPCEWRERVFDVIERCPQHTFQILTKQPQNLDSIDVYPDNVWMGVTVDGLDKPDIIDLNLEFLRNSGAKVKFISFEPLLGPVNPTLRGIDWIIIGQQTGQKAVYAETKWVKYLIARAKLDDISVFLKDNLNWSRVFHEWPVLDCAQEVL